MVVILIYYVFLFFFVLPFGIATEKVLKIRHLCLATSMLLGCISLTVFFSICAFFLGLNSDVFGVSVVLSLLFYWYCREEIRYCFRYLNIQWHRFSKFYKLLFIFLIAIVALKSSGLPFVIDNESYYIQTIKWLNTYGFVKGLANLHVFFAQSSGWHILQAGLNLNFITDKINDLNGFIVLSCNFFYLSEFQKKKQNHWIGFIVLFNSLFFQFIDTPSPDLPILLISQVLFYFFIEKQTDTDTGKIVILLFLFITFIKLTVAPLGLLLLPWFRKKKLIIFFLISCTLFIVLWGLKNSIISGYPLYPFKYFALDVDWLLPEELRFFIDDTTRKTGYFEHKNTSRLSFFKSLEHWFFLSGINGIFNKGMLVLFFIVVLTKSFQKELTYKVVYLFLVVHFLIILGTSPQFRFFLPEFVFFTAIVVSDFINRYATVRVVKPIIGTSILLPVVFLSPIDISVFTENKYHQFLGDFSMTQWVFPQPVSKYYAIEFEPKEKGNLMYYTPKENFFFYGTANGKLPCVNAVYIDYFEYYYNVYPQMRGTNLKQGFYSCYK